MSSILHFSIDHLISWPGFAEVDNQTASPSLPQVPAMQRRRMSPLCKASLHAAFGLPPECGDAPLVFASRYGDIGRSIELLTQLSEGEALSPTQFSLSVHNAIAALHGILSNHRGQYTAISAGGETIEAAFCEALGMLADGASAVRLIACDAPLPEPYHAFESAAEPLLAWGCVIRAADRGPRLSLASTDACGPDHGHPWRFLCGNASAHRHQCGNQTWLWQRHG
ncbi:beta-ketoacyl synthase chain length factor [Chromobacterium violaceum]|uniref:beta-ketoacyl synthase chain length factor n=1 Tax=Chromobacterium violaceum TaxID=536 RepID=UPI001E4F6567|nr:beta-ketoacyl synthase chain length factor [Chromobacterium violaceum]MCD0492241.1 beta-ketoacyl synthase chain length factor [Chromobacterium violaceum]